MESEIFYGDFIVGSVLRFTVFHGENMVNQISNFIIKSAKKVSLSILST